MKYQFSYLDDFLANSSGSSSFGDGDSSSGLPGDGAGGQHDEYKQICDSITADSVEKAQAIDNFPTDNEIEEFLRWRQLNTQRGSYEYWASDLPTKEDRQNLKPLYAAVFYDQLANLIKSRVKIMPTPDREAQGDNKLLLTQILNNYRHYITQKSENFQAAAVLNQYPHPNNDLFSFNGLDMAIGDSIYDLSAGYDLKTGFLSNITFKDKQSVWYCADELLRAYLSRQEVQLHHCIYLNPQVNQSIRVASELIDKIEESRLAVKARILNRATEGGNHHILDMRSWTVVIYVNKVQTDYALDLILRYYKQNYPAFVGRAVPKLAVQIAHGIAIATQEGFDLDRHSFNMHRAEVVDKAWKDFEYYQMSPSSVTHHDIQTFKRIFQEECRKNKVDVRNLAFPDPMTFRS